MRTFYKKITVALIVCLPLVASAQTLDTSSLLAQIQALQAAIAAAQGGSSTTSVGAGSGNCVSLSRSLARGDSGADVTDLQNFLISEGMLSGTATGFYGALTEAAVKQWQSAHGIEPTGNVGPKTRAAMAACAGGATTTTTTQTQTVTQNQCPTVPMPTSCANAISVQINGCTVGWQCSVSTLPPQTFSATPVSGQAPLVVKFSGTVTSANAGFCAGKFCASTLVFGDGKSGAVPIPNALGAAINYEVYHTYATGGNFIAQLYQGSGTGGAVVGNGIQITTTPPASTAVVTPTLTVSPSVGNAPQQVLVTATNVTQGGNLAVEFGDGTFGSLMQNGSAFTVYHTYGSAGSYTIKLRRVNNAGDSCTSPSCPILATAALSLTGGQVASAALTVTPNMGGVPLPVTIFTNSASVAYSGGVVLDFGDGQTEILCQPNVICNQKTVTHTYANAGTYTVQLLALSNAGTTILKTATVSALGPQAAALSATPASGAAPLTTTFTGHGGNKSYINGVVIKYGDDIVEQFCAALEICSQKTKTHTYQDGSQFKAQLVGLGEGDASSTLASFVVSATGGPTKVKVTAPSGSVRKGESVSIAWSIFGVKPTSGSVAFDLYTQAGARIGTILSITNFSSGSATWKIPSISDTDCTGTQPNGLCGVNLISGTYTIRPVVSGASIDSGNLISTTLEIKDRAINEGDFPITISATAIEKGKTLTIKYKVTAPPSNSGVVLWLAKQSGEKLAMIGAKLDADTEQSTFTWKVGDYISCPPALFSSNTVCQAVVKDIPPGDYKITGRVYSPIDKNPEGNEATNHVETSSSAFKIQEPGTGAGCIVLTQDMAPNDTDAQKGGEVSKLQAFLATDPSIYPEGTVSGFYGNATRRAVERWQSANGVASSGSVETNGYGAVGPKTRAAIAAKCGSTAGASLSATPRSGPAALKVTFKGKVPAIGMYAVEFGDGVGGTVLDFKNECPGVPQDNPNAFRYCYLTFDKLVYTYQNNGTFIIKLSKYGSSTPLATVSVTVGGALEEDCAAIARQLTSGDTDAAKGGDVSRLQQYLAKNPSWYPEGLVTGFYGPATAAAVKRYQETNGLAQTGSVGPATLAAIKCVTSGGTTAILEATPMTGAAALAVTFKTSIDVSSGSYRLEYGDDTTPLWLTSQSASHTYNKSGVFTAQLIKSIGNCFGLSGSALKICEVGYATVMGTASIKVTGPTSGTLTASKTSDVAPVTLAFTKTVSAGCVEDTYIDYNDGAVYSRIPATTCTTSAVEYHAFYTNGTYAVKLMNGDGTVLSAVTITLAPGGGTSGGGTGVGGALAKCNTLSAGEWIRRGQYLQSCDGISRLGVKENGAVYYAYKSLGQASEYPEIPITANGLENSSGFGETGSLAWKYPSAEGLKMGANGKLQYYLTPSDVIWETNNVASPGAYLQMSPWFTILTPNGVQIWPPSCSYTATC